MSHFLRLLAEADKADALQTICVLFRQGKDDRRHFETSPKSFDVVPGKPFAYWVSDSIRKIFALFASFSAQQYEALVGLQTSGDFRFLRLSWELADQASNDWAPFAKGGAYSLYYANVHLVVRSAGDFAQIVSYTNAKYPYLNGNARSLLHADPKRYFRPGLTWPRRTTSGIGIRVLPAGCVFADKGPAAFVPGDDSEYLLALLALGNSQAFSVLVALQLAAADAAARSYEVGIIQNTPLPKLSDRERHRLASLARRAWAHKRTLDTVDETSRAFLLPASLHCRLGGYELPAIEADLARIQDEVDAITFDLYGFGETDRAALQASKGAANEDDTDASTDDEGDEEDSAAPINQTAGLLSWAVGVAFGRFDWRLATGERATPPEPEPFAPLPAKSPGILPDGAAPFHAHAGILVDDQGHPHDLAHLIEEVLVRVEVPVAEDVRRWLRRDFFAFHLQRYSKSRRKAPIYWPLATPSGSYTLWLYYPSLSSQTLYTAINDFVEPKLKQIGDDVAALRNKGTARSRDDERQFETLQVFELELIELRDTLLKIAQHYHPNHDDGVQITAAPLWPFFRHKPWQKVLKETWEKVRKGDYDWSHLAMNYWPERVREKCKADKSLAIAHGLEDLYVEPESRPKRRGRKAQED